MAGMSHTAFVSFAQLSSASDPGFHCSATSSAVLPYRPTLNGHECASNGNSPKCIGQRSVRRAWRDQETSPLGATLRNAPSPGAASPTFTDCSKYMSGVHTSEALRQARWLMHVLLKARRGSFQKARK